MESKKPISSNSYTHVSVHLGNFKVVAIKTLNTRHGILSMTSHADHITTGLGTYHGKQQNLKKKKRTQDSDFKDKYGNPTGKKASQITFVSKIGSKSNFESSLPLKKEQMPV